MNKWVSVAISAGVSFVISAGGSYLTIVSSGLTSPNWTQISICIVTGAVMAARDVQKNLSPPPQ